MSRSKRDRHRNHPQRAAQSSKIIIRAAKYVQDAGLDANDNDNTAVPDTTSFTSEAWPSLPGGNSTILQADQRRRGPWAQLCHPVLDLASPTESPNAAPSSPTTTTSIDEIIIEPTKLSLSPLLSISIEPVPAVLSEAITWAQHVIDGQAPNLRALVLDSDADEHWNKCRSER